MVDYNLDMNRSTFRQEKKLLLKDNSIDLYWVSEEIEKVVLHTT